MTSDSAPQRFLSRNQKRLVGTALALVSFTIIVAFLLGIFFVLRAFVGTFYSVIWPLAVAGILAMILRPIVVFLRRRARFSRTWAILSLYIAVVVVLLGILSLLLPTLIEQTIRFINFLPDFIESLRVSFAEAYPSFVKFIEEKLGAEYIEQLKQSVSNMVSALIKAWEPALAKAGNMIASVLAMATGFAIIPVYLFFLLESQRNFSKDLKEELYFLRDDWREDIVFLINEFVGSIVSFFRGQLVIALIMGVLLAIGFTSIGLNFAILLGLAIGFLNIVPYLGSMIGLSTVLPLAYFQSGGGLTLLLLALGVFIVVQMIEGYFLTPRIMGKTTGLHPMLIIIAIFFWGIALDGILGMILAIPLTAFFVVAWRLLKKKHMGKTKALANASSSDTAPSDAPPPAKPTEA